MPRPAAIGPRQWPDHVESAIVDAIGLAGVAVPCARAGATGRRRLLARLEQTETEIALRHFLLMTQEQFAAALGISVHTLRNWEQGRRMPEGPALALLPIAARHPRMLGENLAESS